MLLINYHNHLNMSKETCRHPNSWLVTRMNINFIRDSKLKYSLLFHFYLYKSHPKAYSILLKKPSNNSQKAQLKNNFNECHRPFYKLSTLEMKIFFNTPKNYEFHFSIR